MRNTLHLSLFLIVFNFYNCKNQTNNNPVKEFEIITNPSKKEIKKNTINSDSTLVYKIFRNDIVSAKTKNNDSLILFNKYHLKAFSKNTKNEILLKFKECTAFKDSLKFNERFKHLKTNDWFEEALIIKNSYYEFNNYIIVVDFIKNNLNSCLNIKKEDFIIEQIRLYERREYFEIADKSNSVLYSLKSIDN